MTIADLLLPELESELATTRRVLERVPDDRGEWKPHEKTFPMAHLAQLVSMIPAWTAMVMDQTELDIAPKDGPRRGYTIEKTATLLEGFDKGAQVARDAIARASDADFDVPWTLKRAGETLITGSRYFMLRTTVLNHLVHHRAQLAMYLRLVGEKVPQMYGPTADEK
jgi:uncharacterized damage-inducible protein DinB